MTPGGTRRRVWLITGASSGFGRTISEAALAAGDVVVAAVRRPAALEDLGTAYPDRMSAVALDVTQTEHIDDVVTSLVLWHGRIDVLVNNAGRGLVGAVEETTEAELRYLMDLHFFGPAALIRAVLPHMRRQGTGAIVQMSSVGGRISGTARGAYCASKSALEAMSEALAQEVAPFGIKVLIVEPGSFRTGFAGGALLQSPEIPAYAEIAGPVRRALPATDGKQPGDPAKAAAAIMKALSADQPPLRLPLGSDSADLISRYLDGCQEELRAWQHLARSTDFSGPHHPVSQARPGQPGEGSAGQSPGRPNSRQA
jgi:NAD(P)-dependent dehydrogenase (short-subunit alcohol dehydrogenase family)